MEDEKNNKPDREKPMTPDFWTDGFWCPVCGMSVSWRGLHTPIRYCPYCGQRIQDPIHPEPGEENYSYES